MKAKKIVIKIGSGVLSDKRGKLDKKIIESHTGDISKLLDKGIEVLIVSSGAVSAGIGELGVKKLPRLIPEKQAIAAVGQSKLMSIYSEKFGKLGYKVGQVLLTRSDMEDRRRYVNARYTLDKLTEMKIVPIINENDTVTVDELQFGDNDMLSSIVATKVHADLLIILSDVDGVFDANPKTNKKADLIPIITDITSEMEKSSKGIYSRFGSGGMASKLQAARAAMTSGLYVVIANGRKKGIISDIMSGNFRGTLFKPTGKKKYSSRQRWIAFGRSGINKHIFVDEGARNAIVEGKKSLLPVGIKSVEGTFARGDVVEIRDANRQRIAKGITNFSSSDIKKIKGKRSEDTEKILGHKDYDEVIHRDNLVLLI